MNLHASSRVAFVAGVLVLLGGVAAAWPYRGALVQWLASSDQATTIQVSGNIEAHQSVLGFKTVQSRIVELPFNEGQWVETGALIPRVDDSDYRQQVATAEAALDVQTRQLAAAEQNLAAAKKTVEADEAELELAKLEFSRADDLMKKGVGTIEARDQTNATLKSSNAALERDQALDKSAGGRWSRRRPTSTAPRRRSSWRGSCWTIRPCRRRSTA